MSFTRPLAEELLKKYFGFPFFYDNQWEVIEKLLLGQRVLLIERTGFGKSLCYQFTALVMEGVTIVFSPLIALMRDQVENLRQRNIKAAAIHSNQTEEENRAIIQEAKGNRIKILYIAPERMENAEWIKEAREMHIAMIVIDEAHCISVWGHTFRPNYRRIVNLVNLLPSHFPVLATTATATPRVEKDVAEQIGKEMKVVRGRLLRTNLQLHVEKVTSEDEKYIQIARLMPNLPKPGIIYTGTHADTVIYSNWLKYLGFEAAFYNGRLDAEERKKIEARFMENQYEVIVSTNALGMGIDKSDIRFIIHTQIPQSPIHYYQEIGRAGRDGRPSIVVLYFNPYDDLALPLRFISSAKPSLEDYEKVMEATRKNMLSRNEIILETNLKQNQVSVILADLVEQRILHEQLVSRKKMYFFNPDAPEFDYSVVDHLRKIQREELERMVEYASGEVCRMKYLCDYLGDTLNDKCGVCDIDGHRLQRLPENFKDWNSLLKEFRETFFPVLEVETRGSKMIDGVAASYYGFSQVGETIRRCKYQGGGDFPDWLVALTLKAFHKHLGNINFDWILFVPPTESGDLVKNFAQKIANHLRIPLSHNLIKIRSTRPQKDFQSAISKSHNIAGAFQYLQPNEIKGKNILLIDDVYDSGATLKEIGKYLTREGAALIAPLTIAKTVGGDL